MSEYPPSVNLTDADGRTPLHYAALLKDDGKMTNFLLEHGADESTLDNVNHVPPVSYDYFTIFFYCRNKRLQRTTRLELQN